MSVCVDKIIPFKALVYEAQFEISKIALIDGCVETVPSFDNLEEGEPMGYGLYIRVGSNPAYSVEDFDTMEQAVAYVESLNDRQLLDLVEATHHY